MLTVFWLIPTRGLPTMVIPEDDLWSSSDMIWRELSWFSSTHNIPDDDVPNLDLQEQGYLRDEKHLNDWGCLLDFPLCWTWKRPIDDDDEALRVLCTTTGIVSRHGPNLMRTGAIASDPFHQR
ncbi:hypothetical protein Tco_1403091 [Tanacetum coccineum]